MFLGIITSIITILADQISKYFVINVLLSDVPILHVMHYFNLVTAWNTGVSFSMFSGNGYIGAVVLSVVAIAIVGVLLYWLKKEKSPLLQFAKAAGVPP